MIDIIPIAYVVIIIISLPYIYNAKRENSLHTTIDTKLHKQKENIIHFLLLMYYKIDC